MAGSRWVLRTGIVATGLALVAGCGGGSDNNGGSSDDPLYQGLSGTVTVLDTDGGPVLKAKEETIYKKFEAASGVRVRSEYQPDVTKMIAALESGKSPWSVAEIFSGDYPRLLAEGHLDPLDHDIIPVDRLERSAVHESGVAVEQAATGLAWNTEAFGADLQPSRWEDLYDTDRFPGKRCLFQYPAYGATLESALIADGVAPEELYPLDTDRAFEKLDTIKDDIVWYTDPAQGVQYLATGECVMGGMPNGRIFNAAHKDGQPLAFSWDRPILLGAMLVLPKDGPNREAAEALIAHWINDEEGQRAFVDQTAYPTLIKSLRLEDYSEDVQDFLPVGGNVETAIPEQADYLLKELPTLSEEFTAWVSQ